MGAGLAKVDYIPSRRLSTPSICVRLLGLFPKSCGTVGILLAHCPSIRKVLRSVHHHHQSANLGPIHRHVRVYARSMCSVEICCLGYHFEVVYEVKSGNKQGFAKD